MEAFTVVTGPAIPLIRSNIDTDVIIRMDRLYCSPVSRLGDFALEAIRIKPDGTPDPQSPLNAPQFQAAPILMVGPNFGCGSSREGAVWALRARGIRCVIGESFGDIFFANCFQNGVLPIRLKHEELQQLVLRANDGSNVTVDLTLCLISSVKGLEIPFEINALQRERLLHGLDSIDITLKNTDAIDQWQCNDQLMRPWLWT